MAKNKAPMASYTYDAPGRVVMAQDGTVEQKTHYYPFGGIMYGSTGQGVQPYKYGGKELDRTNGLDSYDFGARSYFADRIQWMTMDPLCEKYYDTSPYAYCKNDPVNMIDLDGNAPGDFFYNIDDAAIDFGLYYNGASINLNIEFGSTIYMITNKKGKIGFTYSMANRGENDNVIPSKAPKGAYAVALIHTHGNSLKDEDGNEYINNYFSGASDNVDEQYSAKINKEHKEYDNIGNANRSGMLYSYLVSPNGSLQKYSIFTGKIRVISEDMPSSYADSDRRNTNEAITNPSIFFERLPFNMNYLDPRIHMEHIKLRLKAILGK